MLYNQEMCKFMLYNQEMCKFSLQVGLQQADACAGFAAMFKVNIIINPLQQRGCFEQITVCSVFILETVIGP
jgi:hypothetical protein